MAANPAGPADPDDPDEAALLAYAGSLADGVDAVLAGWVERAVHRRCREAGRDVDDDLTRRAREEGERCRDEVGPEVRRLLMADPDAQGITPLALLRSAVSYPTGVLSEHGVPPVERDAFDRRAFPDDIYGLTPANFADIDERLAEPGLLWGAAKAHVHLARRRAEGRR